MYVTRVRQIQPQSAMAHANSSPTFFNPTSNYDGFLGVIAFGKNLDEQYSTVIQRVASAKNASKFERKAVIEQLRESLKNLDDDFKILHREIRSIDWMDFLTHCKKWGNSDKVAGLRRELEYELLREWLFDHQDKMKRLKDQADEALQTNHRRLTSWANVFMDYHLRRRTL